MSQPSVACIHLSSGICGIASRLAGCRAAILEGSCESCQMLPPPFARSENRVTASLAILAAKQHLTSNQLQDVIERCEPLMGRQHAYGAGAYLREILKSLGIKESAQCRCREMAYRMNEQGPQWCRENLERIVDWLKDEAKQQGKMYFRPVARQLVLLAITRSEEALA